MVLNIKKESITVPPNMEDMKMRKNEGNDKEALNWRLDSPL